MRVLTEAQYGMLQICLDQASWTAADFEREFGEERLTHSEWCLLRACERHGWVAYFHDEEAEGFDLTPRGRHALAIHRAYLAGQQARGLLR